MYRKWEFHWENRAWSYFAKEDNRTKEVNFATHAVQCVIPLGHLVILKQVTSDTRMQKSCSVISTKKSFMVGVPYKSSDNYQLCSNFIDSKVSHVDSLQISQKHGKRQSHSLVFFRSCTPEK